MPGKRRNYRVAPRRGAWIEMAPAFLGLLLRLVAPRRGTWIEILEAVKEDIPEDVAPRRGA